MGCQQSKSRESAAPTEQAKLFIFFGSQTGTAEAFARMMGTMALSHGYLPHVCSMNDGAEILKRITVRPIAVLIVVSTYGTGEFPSNAGLFAREFDAFKPKFAGVRCAVLGLGNSKNETFNAAAKRVVKLLAAASATEITQPVYSCELADGGHDAKFRGWKRAVWAALGKTAASGQHAAYELKDTVEQPCASVAPANFAQATLVSNVLRSTAGYIPETWSAALKLGVDEQKKLLKGRTLVITDWVEVMPKNPDALVERALKILGVDGNKAVSVKPLVGASPSAIDNKAFTIRTILREVVDLSAVPNRSFIEALSACVKADADRTQLDDLANDLSAASKYDKLSQGVFSVVDLLEMAASASVDLATFLTHAPRIAPRSYSIAANIAGECDTFELLYMIPHKDVNGKVHDGLCTSYLRNLPQNSPVYVRFRESGIPITPHNVPVVFVGLGSGIGSVRAILQHRLAQKKANGSVAKSILYYGHRYTGKDQLFTEELKEFEKEGVIEVVYCPSHDKPGQFIPPMEFFRKDMGEFLGLTGHFHYCGLGGSVPSSIDYGVRRCGVDVGAMRAQGRYHEEFFTPDQDMENLLKDRVSTGADTLAKRMGDPAMFCMQCEQTRNGKGCTKIGVCGKTPTTSWLQDLTVHEAKVLGFYLHNTRELGGPENVEGNRFLLQALFSTLTNVNFDETRFVIYLEQIRQLVCKAKIVYEETCKAKSVAPKKLTAYSLPEKNVDVEDLVSKGKTVGVLTRFTDPERQNAAAVGEMLMYGLKGLAAYTDHSLMNHREDPAIYAFIEKALAYLLEPNLPLDQALALCIEAGKHNVTAMGMLHDSNASLGTSSPHEVPLKPFPGKCILVSGHDFIILKALLEKTEPLNINVYTHGEMLPGHSYPKLNMHKNLVGHFGGAWMRQSVEFPHFPGPVLMTTNCLTEPGTTYGDRLFTAGAVGWKGIPHVGNTMEDINFDAVIAAAKKAKGFTIHDPTFTYADQTGVQRPKSYMVGFAHETVLSHAGTIIEQIQKGNITRFFLVGGCDGYEGDRSYYTELVRNLPKTCVVMTVGCGKYRINHLELGTIGDTGIPRLLDLGQCNDSFSAVQIAVALAGALKCEVTDLPLSIILSWFEQKAVAVLLSCIALGLKPLHIGPTLPAFLTHVPDVLNLLVKNHGLIPLGDPLKDMEIMLAAKKMA